MAASDNMSEASSNVTPRTKLKTSVEAAAKQTTNASIENADDALAKKLHSYSINEVLRIQKVLEFLPSTRCTPVVEQPAQLKGVDGDYRHFRTDEEIREEAGRLERAWADNFIPEQDKGDAALQIGRIYMYLNEPSRGVPYLSQLVSGAVACSRQTICDAHKLLTLLFLRKRNSDDAKTCSLVEGHARSWLQSCQQPEQLTVLRLLAVWTTDRPRLDSFRMETLRELIVTDPEPAWSYRELALHYIRRNQLTVATEYIQKYILDFPAYRLPYDGYGEALDDNMSTAEHKIPIRGPNGEIVGLPSGFNLDKAVEEAAAWRRAANRSPPKRKQAGLSQRLVRLANPTKRPDSASALSSSPVGTSPPQDVTKRSVPAFTFGTKPSMKAADDRAKPGPGAYQTRSSVATQAESTKRTAPQPTFGTRTLFGSVYFSSIKQSESMPGPGTHYPEPYSHARARMRALKKQQESASRSRGPSTLRNNVYVQPSAAALRSKAAQTAIHAQTSVSMYSTEYVNVRGNRHTGKKANGGGIGGALLTPRGNQSTATMSKSRSMTFGASASQFGSSVHDQTTGMQQTRFVSTGELLQTEDNSVLKGAWAGEVPSKTSKQLMSTAVVSKFGPLALSGIRVLSDAEQVQRALNEEGMAGGYGARRRSWKEGEVFIVADSQHSAAAIDRQQGLVHTAYRKDAAQKPATNPNTLVFTDGYAEYRETPRPPTERIEEIDPEATLGDILADSDDEKGSPVKQTRSHAESSDIEDSNSSDESSSDSESTTSSNSEHHFFRETDNELVRAPEWTPKPSQQNTARTEPSEANDSPSSGPVIVPNTNFTAATIALARARQSFDESSDSDSDVDTQLIDSSRGVGADKLIHMPTPRLPRPKTPETEISYSDAESDGSDPVSVGSSRPATGRWRPEPTLGFEGRQGVLIGLQTLEHVPVFDVTGKVPDAYGFGTTDFTSAIGSKATKPRTSTQPSDLQRQTFGSAAAFDTKTEEQMIRTAHIPFANEHVSAPLLATGGKLSASQRWAAVEAVEFEKAMEPGPGHYLGVTSASKNDGPAISLKGKLTKDDSADTAQNSTPGPDQCVSDSALGKQVSSLRRTMGGVKLNPRGKEGGLPEVLNMKQLQPGDDKHDKIEMQTTLTRDVEVGLKHKKGLPGPGTYQSLGMADMSFKRYNVNATKLKAARRARIKRTYG